MLKSKEKTETPAGKAKKPKRFKLGEKASLFVDPSTQKKIAGKQIVEFLDAEMLSTKFKDAKRHGHIVLADDDDVEPTVEVNKELVAFLALPNDAAKAEFLKSEYENSDEEETAIDAMNSDQLLAEFKKAEGIED